MTPWQSRATKLTQRMADDMKLRNFAQATIDAYTYHVGRFAEFVGKCCKRYVAECRELFPGQTNKGCHSCQEPFMSRVAGLDQADGQRGFQ